MDLWDYKADDARDDFAKSMFIQSMDICHEDVYDEAELEIKNYFATNQALHAKHPKLQHKNVKKYLQDSMLVVLSDGCALLSFDIEAWEQNTNNILEIGMSIYDPRNQKGALIPIFKNIHIVVEEFENCHNGRFVPDRKNKFMGIDSIKMKLNDIRYFIQGIIDYYHSTNLALCFVGHSLEGDLTWLRSMGVDIPNTCEIDTHTIFQYSRMKDQPTNLSSALLKVDIPHGYLHNAGNDAYYTLLLAFKLCDPKVRALYKLDVWQPDEVWDNRNKRQRNAETSNLTKMHDHRHAVRFGMNSVFGGTVG